MSIIQPVQIEVAQHVFETWDKLGVIGRAERLSGVIRSLDSIQGKMATWQLENAKNKIAAPRVLPGPTGEHNELSTQGRGVFLCDDLIKSSSSQVGLIGQIFAALVSGNTVITVGTIGQSIMDIISPVVPDGVIQNVANSAQESIIEAEHLAGVAILCKHDQAQSLDQKLAAKSGLICQLVEETNTDSLSTIASPQYILRFITEQTVSVNTTAIGGNATLLELGSKDG